MLQQQSTAGALRIVFGLTTALLLAPPAYADDIRPPERVSFFFAAHEDDWQLFMNPSAFADVADPKTKAVFIHVTAGDAGNGQGTRGRKHPYYLARENGADVAIRFMADAGEQPSEKAVTQLTIKGHSITRVGYRNTATYFLRLPDGHPAGIGFEGTGYQSLARLAKGEIDTMSTIDGATTYRGWTDLVATLKSILENERGTARAMQLNMPEPDTRINAGDHSDHLLTAKLALDAAKDFACARRLYYVNYASSAMPENLKDQQRDQESSVLAATAAGLLALDHASVWHPYHRTYLGRNYFRVEEGAGDCAVVTAAPAAPKPSPSPVAQKASAQPHAPIAR